MNKFDVAIIGAGPAGSVAAISLARRGYSVALIDKEPFPREKLCGDFINPSNRPMLDQLGVTCELFMQDHEIVTAFRITAASGAAAEAALPSIDGAPVYGLGLRRFFFDQILLSKAQQEGVTALTGCRIKALHRQADGWCIGYGRGESIEELNVRVLIGADGRNSWVAHHLGMAGGAARGGGRVGFQLRLKCSQNFRGRVEIHLFPGGYAGVLGLGDGTINLCLAADRRRFGERVGGRVSIDALLESHLAQNPHLKEILRLSDPVGAARSTYPVYFPPRRSVGDGVMLIGDAARVNEPVSGEGIYFAMRSAAIAAVAVDQAFGRGDFSVRELFEYERRCRAEFRLRRGLNGAIRFLMYRPALLLPFIRLSGKKKRLLESLVHAICRPEAAA
jgi:geranylgeranyl reductase family protein